MGNCLVTKLKSSVNNPELLKMDEMLFSVVASSYFSIGNSGETINVTGLDGITFDVFDGSDNLLASSVNTYTGNRYVRLKNFSKTGKVKIDNKFSFTTFRPDRKVDFDVSVLKYLNFVYFQVYTFDATTEVNTYEMPPSVRVITDYSGLKGDVKYLGRTNVSSLYATSRGKVTGELIDFVVETIKNARYNGSLGGGNWKLSFAGDTGELDRNYCLLEWSPISGTSNYTVSCKAGSSASSLTYNRTVTIDANGNIIS